MKNLNILLLITTLCIFGCASGDRELSQTLKKNPKIIFDVIEENPELFLEVVNRAALNAQQKQLEKKQSEMKSEQEKEILSPKQPALSKERRLEGTDSSDITLVEYADFQCPACKMAFENIKKFKDKYKGRVQFYYKHMPLDFHKMAYPAALYFEAVKQQDLKKAQRFFDLIYQKQWQLTDEIFLKKTAQSVGANLVKILSSIQSKKTKSIIEADMTEFQNFGFTGTPIILINGVALHGAQSVEEMERIMNLTIKKSEK